RKRAARVQSAVPQVAAHRQCRGHASRHRAAAADEEMKKFLAILLLCAPAALAQFDAPVVPPQIKVDGAVTKRAGHQVEGTITVAIPPTWHVNSNKPLDHFAIPTAVPLDAPTAGMVSAHHPPHDQKNTPSRHQHV